MTDTNPNPDKPKPYMSYRGLGYTPMFAGVPLFVALALLGGVVLAMILLVAGAPLFAVGLLVVLMAIFFFFKVLCENNNKAPMMFVQRIRGLLYRLAHGKIVKVDLGVESDEQRKKFRQQFKSLIGTKRANS